MIGHTQLNQNKSKVATATTTATATTSYVQQTAKQLESQLSFARPQYDTFLQNLSAPPDSVQVPKTAQADQIGRAHV